MTAIITPKAEVAPINTAKSGDGYDRCPHDGCIEVEPTHVNGGIDTKREEYRNWFMYSADRRRGGCGGAWTRTTKQGRAHDAQSGVDSRWLTKDAATERSYSMPSDQYRDNYAAVFGHD